VRLGIAPEAGDIASSIQFQTCGIVQATRVEENNQATSTGLQYLKYRHGGGGALQTC
jgi:hypothetical protein